MLDLKEVRVGNIIKDDVLGQVEVYAITDCRIKVISKAIDASGKSYDEKFTLPEIDCSGIPLSRDWMFKLGFEAFPWGWVKKSRSDFGVRLNLQSFSYDVSGNYPVRLQFVHQLQNLFFVLTGEELIVSNGA